MRGKFIPRDEAERERLDWGGLAWLSRPQTTGAKALVVIEVSLAPGGGHAFHKHPRQEEVIYVVSGSIEQWLEGERRTLGPGDSIFIPSDTVHASFNRSGSEARLVAILGPCAGPAGYELVDVSGEAPWKSLL